MDRPVQRRWNEGKNPATGASNFCGAAETLEINHTRRDLLYTWTPKECEKIAQTTKNSLKGHYSTYFRGPGSGNWPRRLLF